MSSLCPQTHQSPFTRAFQSAIRNKITLVKTNTNTFCYILVCWFFSNVSAHLRVDLQNFCGSHQDLKCLCPVRELSEAICHSEHFRKETSVSNLKNQWPGVAQGFQTSIFNRLGFFPSYRFLSDRPFLPQNMRKFKCMCRNMLILYVVHITVFGNKTFFHSSQICKSCHLA